MLEFLFCFWVLQSRCTAAMWANEYESAEEFKDLALFSFFVYAPLATLVGAFVFRWVFNSTFHVLGLPEINVFQAALLYGLMLNFMPYSPRPFKANLK